MKPKTGFFIVELCCAVLVGYVVLFADWDRWFKSVSLFLIAGIFVYALINLLIIDRKQESRSFASYEHDDTH